MRYLRLSFLLFVFLYSCKTSGTEKIFANDCRATAIPCELDRLYTHPYEYNNKEIEIQGYYKWDSERSALYPNNSFSGRNAIWVDFSGSDSLKNDKGDLFNDSVSNFKNMTGRKIRITGLYKSGSSGHLGEYNGSIAEICRLEIYY